MTSIITHLKPVSLFKRFFGTITIFVALYIILFQSMLFGFFMMSFGVYLTSTEGSQMNLEDNTYRNIWSLFSIHIGNWKPNPNFEYISVFKGRQKQRVNSLGASTTFSDEVFLVNLFYERNRHKTFYRTFDKEKAFEVARQIRTAMDLKILDATEREQKWVE